MANNIFPEVNFFVQPIVDELRLDVFKQRNKMAERLANFPPEKMSELHLADWYGQYWKLLDILKYTNEPQEQKLNIARQIWTAATAADNPVQRQYFALALLMFGVSRESQMLMNQDLWSPELREDFSKYTAWTQLINGGNDPMTRAKIRRNQALNIFLQKKFAGLIEKYSSMTFDETTCPKISSRDFKIFYCWLQGEKNLPTLARCCYNSLKENAGDYEVVFIDAENYSKYVKLPEHIVKKFKGGGITPTHFSDVLRFNLLERYGGMWIDATILVTEPLERHKDLIETTYFTQKFFVDKRNYNQYSDVSSYGRWAGFLQSTNILHNPLFVFVEDFYNKYWRDFDEIIDYVLMDFMIDIAYENIAFVKNEMDAVPINNTDIWTLQKFLDTPYKNFPYDKVLKGNFFHKISSKHKFDDKKDGTVFKEIQRRYAPKTL